MVILQKQHYKAKRLINSYLYRGLPTNISLHISNHMLLQLVSRKSILKTLIAEETKHKTQLFTSITNVDFARLVLKMFSIFYAAVQKCQADTTYH